MIKTLFVFGSLYRRLHKSLNPGTGELEFRLVKGPNDLPYVCDAATMKTTWRLVKHHSSLYILSEDRGSVRLLRLGDHEKNWADPSSEPLTDEQQQQIKASLAAGQRGEDDEGSAVERGEAAHAADGTDGSTVPPEVEGRHSH